MAFNIPDAFRPYVSAATRQADEPLTLTPFNWRDLAEAQYDLPIAAKVERLLKHIGDRAGIPGGSCWVDADLDYPLFSAAVPKELNFYLRSLQRDLYVEGPKQNLIDNELLTGRYDYSPTMKGWQ